MWKGKPANNTKQSIKRKILMIAIVPILILAACIIPYVSYQSNAALEGALHEKGQSIINQLALSSEYGLITGNMVELNSIIKKLLASESEVLSIKVFDSESRLIISQTADKPFNQTVQFSKLIRSPLQAIDTFDSDDDLHLSEDFTDITTLFQTLGTIELSLSKHLLEQKQFNFILDILLIGLVAFIISVYIAYRIAHKFSKQLTNITAAVKEISSGNLEIRSQVTNNDEIGQLATNINNMTTELYKANKAVKEQLVEINQARENAENANQAKDEFLALISHEIRTPLNSVLGMLQALEDTSVNDIQKRYIRVSLDNANHLIGLIDDILNFSSLSSGGINIEKEACDLVQISNQIINNYKLAAENKGIYINFEFHGDHDLYDVLLLIDPTRIKQILINLISNAVKFTEDGGITISIAMKPKQHQQAEVTLTVKDTGIGIDKNDLPHIFDTFSRADSSTNRNFEGIGLGLSITKQLVNLMHGSIDVESEKTQGTTFVAKFIFDYIPKKQNSKNTLQKTAHIHESFNILLAEDNASNQEIFTALFKNYGAEIDIATHGKVALECLEKKPYDILFVDCHMPGMDGFELVKRLRASKTVNQAIPIIAITADILPATQKKCYEVGMDDFIPKPIRKFDLYNKTETWLSAQKEVDNFFNKIF